MELADVTDSKSVDGDIVWVRVPPPAPKAAVPFGDGCFCVIGWDSKARPEQSEGAKQSSELFCRAWESPTTGTATPAGESRHQISPLVLSPCKVERVLFCKWDSKGRYKAVRRHVLDRGRVPPTTREYTTGHSQAIKKGILHYTLLKKV